MENTLVASQEYLVHPPPRTRQVTFPIWANFLTWGLGRLDWITPKIPFALCPYSQL